MPSLNSKYLKNCKTKRFVNNAPAKVVELERKKLADAEDKIKIIGRKFGQFELGFVTKGISANLRNLREKYY